MKSDFALDRILVTSSADTLQIDLPVRRRSLFSILKTLLYGNLILIPLSFLFVPSYHAEDPTPFFVSMVAGMIFLNIFLLVSKPQAFLQMWELNHQLTLTPYLLTYKNFFLPTHLIIKLGSLENGPSPFLSLMTGTEFGIYWQGSPNPDLENEKSANWVQMTNPDIIVSDYQNGLNYAKFPLFLKASEYSELLDLVNTWLQSHAEEITQAGQQDLNQAVAQLKPPSSAGMSMIQQGSHIQIKLKNAHILLKLYPDKLVFSGPLGQPELDLLKVTDVQILTGTRSVEHGDGFQSFDCKILTVRYDQSSSQEIYFLPFFDPKMNELDWLKDMLTRYYLQDGSPK